MASFKISDLRKKTVDELAKGLEKFPNVVNIEVIAEGLLNIGNISLKSIPFLGKSG